MAAVALLPELIAALGGDLLGAAESLAATRIARIATLEDADAESIAFLANPRYAAQLAGTKAGCVIVAPAMADAAVARAEGVATLVTPDPYLYFARLTQWWAARGRSGSVASIHASAFVDPAAQLGAGVSIGPFAVVEAGAVIGDAAVIGPHCVIERGAHVGVGSRLASHVSVYHDCVIGDRCIIHSGAVIGADGFGFAPNQGQWEKIEQLGAVRIGNDVEIGAQTCIDRGALGNTVIEDGVKLDNLIQIAHNVHIGAHTAMAACSGVAGSTRIGRHCMIGGAANIVGHITIADHVFVSACTFVTRSIHKPGQYTGVFPMDENANWEKNAATLKQLHAMRDRLRALEKKS
ncbi:UDP-3-O-(3-hydroxymyristoyl)glucosamine N-acyltransferase [Paucibacter soli]|uniref:UDP-3-O-(3-hydroxymyristoyl)glucosamine N-acyltransferase n=1 Tax=Paucibacter soli TaxID=3133433 RepID=UPI0030B3FDC9